jgi:hypothetical protein
VNTPDKAGAVQNVSFDPTGERPTENQYQFIVFGKMKVPGGLQFSKKGCIVRSKPVDFI